MRAPAEARPATAPFERSRMGRILVIRHRAGGDLLLTTPAFRALRAAIPGASIHVVASKGMGDLLRGNPDVDRVIEFDRRSLPSQIALYARLARGGYDVVLDMVSNPRSALLTALTRAPIRVGYDIRGRRRAYTVRVPREPEGPEGPIARYAPEGPLDLVRALGIEPLGWNLTLRVAEDAQRIIDRWLGEQGLGARPIVLCLPAGSWPSKRWIPERFAAAMDALSDRADIVWLWGPGEEALARDCRGRMRNRSAFAPSTGWQELAALLSRSALLVSNDSGPKHVAVALGVPTVTLFGPTNPRAWQPPEGPHTALWARGLDCLHCNHTVCPLEGPRHMRCMRDVPVDGVVDASRERLRAGKEKVACGSR